MRRSLALLALLCAFVSTSAAQITVSDQFGRDLQSRALQLTDWEGYIANPAIPFILDIPESWRPATIEIAGSGSRLQFADRRLSRAEPSTVSYSGPRLTLTVAPGQVIDPVYVTIWPDRDTKDEAYTLWIGVHTASSGLQSLRLPVLVDDQDQDRPLDFEVHVETSYDQSGFYANPAVLEETQRAADDWAYFLGDNDVDEVRRGSSRSWIWNKDGFVSGYWVTNPVAYQGFMLYAWGMQGTTLFSGGAASGQFQTRGGWPIEIMSGGHVAMETRGNHNILGWAFNPLERDWLRSQNLGREVNDFYSIVHHQIGHALFFSPGHVRWDSLRAVGGSTDRDVLEYLSGPAIVDRFDHIYDSGNEEFIVDPASRRGAFGSEYAQGEGIMAPYRWLPTKTDFLLARQIGYELRETTPFVELTLDTAPAAAHGGVEYSQALVVGGIRDYRVEVVDGHLPAGLALDGFSGVLSGTPTQGGAFNFTVRVTDQLGKTVEGAVAFSVGSALANEGGAELPRALSLSNFPNPVAGETVFRFEVTGHGMFALEVYDLQGRLVGTPLQKTLSGGSHDVAWDARELPPGVYLARLSGPGTLETKPVVVLR